MTFSPIRTTLVFCTGAIIASAAQAQVTISDAWVRATVPQQQATGAFMRLTADRDSKLVSAESPAARIVEVHEMAMQDNVMKMRQVAGVVLPAGKAVELRPGGYHIMLIELKQQIRAGDKVPLTLVFETADGKRESVAVSAPARALNGGGMSHDAHQ